MQELILHQPPHRSWGSPNLSPFCAKLECYLRVAEVPYRPGKPDFRRAPKGKIPFVELDGALMGDSQLIIEELERRLATEGKRPLDQGMAPRDVAIARMIRRTIEEGLYFVGLYARWQTNEGYALMRDEFKKIVPGFILPIIRRAQVKKLHAQGTGRHTFEEAMAMGTADLDALAELLGDKPFILGDQPRVIDCTVFGFLETVLGFPLETPLGKRGQHHGNLVAFRKRIRDRWWPDLPALQS
ncbi:MAG TPA: glutathione S-transferase family protein [Kofleriaceae bacterium]